MDGINSVRSRTAVRRSRKSGRLHAYLISEYDECEYYHAIGGPRRLCEQSGRFLALIRARTPLLASANRKRFINKRIE